MQNRPAFVAWPRVCIIMATLMAVCCGLSSESFRNSARSRLNLRGAASAPLHLHSHKVVALRLKLHGGGAEDEDDVSDDQDTCAQSAVGAIFKEVPEKISLADKEHEMLDFWDRINAFQTSIQRAREEGRERWVFFDGPPFATGMPHYGHILAGTIKDIVARFWAQNGRLVERKWGWDCHGLPVEYEMQQTLNISTRAEILDMGIPAFNKECRSVVLKYAEEWKRIVRRMARWVDMDKDYKTMDTPYMETVWWVCSTLFSKGLVYKAFKVMPYSTGCATALSNFEANLNYKQVSDPAVVVALPLLSDPGLSLLVWTTTPWTLPFNLGVCANPEFSYVEVKDKQTGARYILLEERLEELYGKNPKSHCTVTRTISAAELEGVRYEPLFPYLQSSFNTSAFRVVLDSYVTKDSGTGLVHLAPGFGEDDYRVCVATNIVGVGDPRTCQVDEAGCYTDVISGYAGRYVKDCDKDITKDLKARGRLVKAKTVVHSYPFCWRSETPLIYKAVPSWFVRVEGMKENLLACNAQTRWVPDFVKEKRFHNWLVGARDWAISRDRFWGTPLPIWHSEDWEEVVCVSSVEHLKNLSGVAVSDLHREFIDQITIPSQREGHPPLRRVSEVFDCWFESGCMPYAQLHYPFENKDEFESRFPADFIAEGLDQTRGWFYTLMVIATALFNKPPFKNVIVNGLVLAADGKKMSKRLKNYPNPESLVETYGADALRLYLINSPVVKAEPLKFREDGVREIVRDVLLPWYNAYRFFVQQALRTQSSGLGAAPATATVGAVFLPSANIMDRWIQAGMAELISFVRREMEAYRLYSVVPRLVSFIDDLTNWYVRLNRKRIKGEHGAEDAGVAHAVLLQVLLTLTRLMAPFTPLLSELVYQNLRAALPEAEREESVHLVSFPEECEAAKDLDLERQVDRMQKVVTAGRAARDRRQINLKTPMKSATLHVPDRAHAADIEALSGYVKTELNVRELRLVVGGEGEGEGEGEGAAAEGISLKASPLHSILGKRLGGKYKGVAAGIGKLSASELRELQLRGSLHVCGEEVRAEEVKIGLVFTGDGAKQEAVEVEGMPGTMMVLDVEIDLAAATEAVARDFVNRIQRFKKKLQIVPTDKIRLAYHIDSPQSEAGSGLAAAIEAHASLVASILHLHPTDLSKPEAITCAAAEIVGESTESIAVLNGHTATVVVKILRE